MHTLENTLKNVIHSYFLKNKKIQKTQIIRNCLRHMIQFQENSDINSKKKNVILSRKEGRKSKGQNPSNKSTNLNIRT